jgi:uncharacterized protein YdaU (DUF1376 family)
MTKPPAFQFYVKDWLSGTRRLSLAAKGAYIDLLAWSWENGPLPRGAKAIAREIGADASEFRRLWKELRRHWIFGPHGYTNGRLESERRKFKAFRKIQSEKGKASAEARLNRGSTGKPTDTATETLPASGRLGSTGGQPSLALALSSADLDQDQEQRADAHRVLVKLAHQVLDEATSVPGPADPLADLGEELKLKAAQAHLPYQGTDIAKALESAIAQRRRSA